MKGMEMEIEVTQDAVDTLAEALDDALIMYALPVDKLDSLGKVSAQVLSVLAQFGWELVSRTVTPSEDNDAEPRELNLLAPGTIGEPSV